MKHLLIFVFLLLNLTAFAQLDPWVSGNTTRQGFLKMNSNDQYLKTLIDNIETGGGTVYNGDPTIIQQDATHRFVTDIEKAAYAAKADANHNHDSDYAAISHNHDLLYAALGHNHDAAYAPIVHTHDLTADHGDITATGTNGTTWTIDANAVTTTKINNSAVTGAKIAPATITDSDVNDVAWGKITGAPSFSLSTHNHDGVYEPEGDYALSTHNHDASYALLTHNHDATYSLIGHNHTGVYEPEGDYALSSHNHDAAYSAITHNHDGTYATPAQVNAKVEDNITDGATTTAPSENAVFDALAGKQATLVSGTNIKTIDGVSILGSGNITTGGGSGGNTTIYLAADDVNNNATANTLEDLPTLQIPVSAGTTYYFRFYLPYTSAATTTGSRWTLNGPAFTFLYHDIRYNLTATSETFVKGAMSYGQPSNSNASSAMSATAANTAIIEGVIRPSASGTLLVRYASEISNSAITVKTGAFVEYRVTN